MTKDEFEVGAWLSSNGYLNELQDSAERKGRRIPTEAYCDSSLCGGKVSRIKNVEKTAIDCPDCGHALYWRRKLQRTAGTDPHHTKGRTKRHR